MTRRPVPHRPVPHRPMPGRHANPTTLTHNLLVVDRRLSATLQSWVGRIGWGQARRQQQLLPEVAMRLSRTIHSGRPLEHALIDAAELDHAALRRLGEQLAAGRPVRAAIDDWAAKATTDAEQLLVAALSVGCESGADLARALDLVGGGLRDDLQLDARRRTLLTQSRMSAAVLVSLPVVFATVASMLQGKVIYQGAGGLLLLAVGLGLDLLGLAWIKRLLAGLT